MLHTGAYGPGNVSRDMFVDFYHATARLLRSDFAARDVGLSWAGGRAEGNAPVEYNGPRRYAMVVALPVTAPAHDHVFHEEDRNVTQTAMAVLGSMDRGEWMG
jgi:hypothetical protein